MREVVNQEINAFFYNLSIFQNYNRNYQFLNWKINKCSFSQSLSDIFLELQNKNPFSNILFWYYNTQICFV